MRKQTRGNKVDATQIASVTTSKHPKYPIHRLNRKTTHNNLPSQKRAMQAHPAHAQNKVCSDCTVYMPE
uniref:Uncharacterized protein n=1 Tax=Arion vulgaris TaxID=1028688 RepID=A0A0B7A3A3_9EUPU